ncbi:hypothetical protein RJ641_006977 [Dillenia turbinata]|uniref:BIG2 domain-containing protein n=1 Tax=Dillenia turbinata TaxID=194707 RepID=A0AAN8VEC2_9MAGN
MASMKRLDLNALFLLLRLLCCCLLVSSQSGSVSGPHIADVNILLPPKMTNPVEYRLQGSDGCFKWSWDHHDVLDVLPEYNTSNHCSTSARLRSIAPYSGRKETAVYAADVNTGIVIRCKIFHNSIKLDLDGLSTLRVRAFDGEDNVFSSLVGLQFMWQLIPETDGIPPNLAHVPLKDSPLSDCGGLCGDLNVQIKLEEAGVFSDLFVVKGTGIGHEIVSVHLHEPKFEYMADKIVLTVVEPISIDPPSPVFVLKGATVNYSLKVLRENVPQAIKLPSPYHRWSVMNSSVAQVDPLMGSTYAMSMGETTILAEDIRVAGHMQTSSLHVVLPDTICLYLLPLSASGNPIDDVKAIPSVARWYVVSGRKYLIYTKVFSREPGAPEIYLTESDDVRLQYDESECWKTYLVPSNFSVEQGWWNSRILKASKYGVGKLTASLAYHGWHLETKEVLKVVQEIMVCEQVKFNMDKLAVFQSIYLPWAPAVNQELELKAIGGCAKASADYKWFSSDMAIVSVSASGVAYVKKPGKATVRVVSIFDSLNYDEVAIEVSIPSSMMMLHSFPVETVVGSQLKAAVTMKASDGAFFYECDAFNSFIKWTAGSESFTIVNVTGEFPVLDKIDNVELDESLFVPVCGWTYVYASAPGRAMLHATLSKENQHFDHHFSGSIVLRASSLIAAYSPLIVQQAGDGNQFGGYWFDLVQAEGSAQLEHLESLYLVPGTHLEVKLIGGPEPWDHGIDFIETVDNLDVMHTPLREGIVVHRISTGRDSLYRVLCHTLGTFRLIFKRGNLVGDDHPLPAVAEVDLSVHCSFPSSIVVIADEPVNAPDVIRAAIRAKRGPAQIQSNSKTVANSRTIRVAAVGITDSGKAFANSSSLSLMWELSSCDRLAVWDDAIDSESSKYVWERFLALQNASGMCIVRAAVTGILDRVTERHSAMLLESSENVLTDAIRLQLVSSLLVSPKFMLLYFGTDAKANLSISGGSCFLDTAVNNTQVVEVILPQSDVQCLQLTVIPKGIGTALVTVYDIGLSPPLAASSLVQVADLDWIKITSSEEISIMEGDSQSVEFLAGIHDGNTFDPSQLAYMNIHVHIEDQIFDLVNDGSASNGYICGPYFIIHAKRLGVTRLFVSAKQQSGQEIVSQTIQVEVFAPPRLHPHYIYLAPGASYTLTMKGGPKFGMSVEFASKDECTAKIHRLSGKLSAISPGNTTILAAIYGKGDIVLCQTHCRVKVGIPLSMALHAQSDQLSVGREMPGNLFSFYQICKDYRWTVDDEKVLSFQTADQSNSQFLTAGGKEIQSSIFLDDKDIFIRTLYGRSAGSASVAVSISCNFSSGSFSQLRSYNASTTLLVVPDLPLALGGPSTWVLPPNYTTSSLLPLSSEIYSQWHNQSWKGTIAYSMLRHCGGRNEDVQKDSIIIVGDKIKTTESNDLACIQAKDRVTGRVEIASCVRVAEVAQIRLTTDFLFNVINLASGDELELQINYRDILGNPFHEAYNVILHDAETNFPDIVGIDVLNSSSGSFHLKAIHGGRALVRVSIDGNPHKSDYILVSVGPQIHPCNPVIYLGSCLNFSIQGSKDQTYGRWTSTNGSVLSINMLSGKAQAVGEGRAQVIFEGPNLRQQTEATVLKGNIVLVDAPRETLTNVPFSIKGYNFPVKFSDADDHKLNAYGSNKNVLYDCTVSPTFIGYVTPWRDLNTGNLYCLFFPHSPEHLAHSLPKSNDFRPDMFISISASLRGSSHASGSASALFIGGFSILEMDKESLQLNLSPDSNNSIFTIAGNTDVEIHWLERDLMIISPIHGKDFGIGGQAQFEIKVQGAKKFKDKIVISLPANGQKAEIDVNYDPGEKTASATTINFTLWGSILACLIVLILTIALFIRVLDRPDRSRPAISPATPSRPASAPVTPDRTSTTPVVNELSPRTPQPFMEYVRRTIDETPYYRREGRRFNPQNTY